MWWGSSSSVKRLRRMMEAIRSRDFTLQYALDRLRGEERLLAREINEVITEFRETQVRQEAMYGQFQTLLDQINTSLIVDDGTGRVMWMNRRAVDELCGFRIASLDMLGSLHKDIPAALESLKPGEQRLLRLHIGGAKGRDVEWSVSMSRYYRQGDFLRLFSIENLQTVLQQNEVDAQRRLVSVLTHEIMNSLAPIISLSETLMDISSGDERQALAAIHRRSQGLLTFVENYRQLSRIPAPQKSIVKVGELIAGIQSLMPSPSIVYKIENSSEEIDIDRQQMEQVLINLLKNAQETGCDSITLATHADRYTRRFFIIVTDNGPGILPDVLDRIFIPFFTTKPGGSGIGLSICRQIVINHGGTIRVNSEPGKTEFIVEL